MSNPSNVFRSTMVTVNPQANVYRNPWGANPITPPHRRMIVDIHDSTNPRFMHPKLNQTPWSSSYAQKRDTPKTEEVRFKVNRRRRVKREQGGKRKAQ